MTAQMKVADDGECTRDPEVRRTVKRTTPFPWQQFSIVLFIHLAEPITSQVISPFAPQLMRDIGASDEKVGYYVGIMHSLFFVCEAMTVLHWSHLSDMIGRKPVILGGLFGLALSMTFFGLQTTFWGLVFSRCMAGALNGNVGVIKSIIPEITDSTNIAQAFAYMPLAWSFGSAIAPAIGGSLAHPVERFPQIFGNSEFFHKYPYFLPCAASALFSIISWQVAFWKLHETVPSPTPVLVFLGFKKAKLTPLENGLLIPREANSSEKAPSFRQLITPRVIVAAGNYAFLALVDISFASIRPVMYATPIRLGGLGMSTPEIGKVLSVCGIINGIFQPLCFAQLVDRFGHKRVYLYGIASYAVVIGAFPFMSIIMRAREESELTLAVRAILVVQTFFSVLPGLSYGSVFIYIAAAAPNKRSLGATNGLAQMLISIMRAVGPAIATSFFALSIEHNLLWGYFVYVILGAMAVAAAIAGMMLPPRVWEKNEE